MMILRIRIDEGGGHIELLLAMENEAGATPLDKRPWLGLLCVFLLLRVINAFE